MTSSPQNKEMMMTKLILLIGLLTFGLQDTQGARKPDWVTQTPNKPHLFQGIGVADNTGSKEADRLRADQSARTEIIQEISSTISSSVNAYYSESTSTNAGTSVGENLDVFTSLSSAYAEATVEGIKIVDRYYDRKSKTYYSYATLSRSDFQSQMARKAESARQLAAERYQFALSALASKDVAGALDQLSQALSHVMIAQSIIKSQLKGSLDPASPPTFLDAALSHELSKITGRIRLTKSSGEGQKGERNQALGQAFVGQVVFAGEDGSELPVPNLPLALLVEGAEADYEPVIRTNALGTFRATIHKVHSAERATPTVKINLYLPHIAIYADQAGVARQDVMPPGVDFGFQMDVAASVQIFVRVLEEINGVPVARSKSDGILIKALLSKKYKVIDARRIASTIPMDELDQFVTYEAFDSITDALKGKADYAIIGLIYSETSSTGTLNYARATANLHALDLSSGRIVATGQMENVKAAGNTESKANTSAIRKCSNNAIAQLLAQLDKAL